MTPYDSLSITTDHNYISRLERWLGGGVRGVQPGPAHQAGHQVGELPVREARRHRPRHCDGRQANTAQVEGGERGPLHRHAPRCRSVFSHMNFREGVRKKKQKELEFSKWDHLEAYFYERKKKKIDQDFH